MKESVPICRVLIVGSLISIFVYLLLLRTDERANSNTQYHILKNQPRTLLLMCSSTKVAKQLKLNNKRKENRKEEKDEEGAVYVHIIWTQH